MADTFGDRGSDAENARSTHAGSRAADGHEVMAEPSPVSLWRWTAPVAEFPLWNDNARRYAGHSLTEIGSHASQNSPTVVADAGAETDGMTWCSQTDPQTDEPRYG
jgi:hypothetical protein